MKGPYPTELVPLLPEFLNKRRGKFTFPLRVADELGIDRPTASFVVGTVAPAGGGRFDEMGNPYATHRSQWEAAAAAARAAGLVEESGGRWDLTSAGRALVQRTRREADAHLASLPDPLPRGELAQLAELLGRAFSATAGALERRWHDHIPRAARMAGDGTRGMVALENAVYALWQARDDCHMAAWKQAGLDGPTLDALTRIWRREASTEDELASKLTAQRPSDIARELEQLRRDGLVERGTPLRTTEVGTTSRQAIEDETDRLFFAPWPDDVGARSVWIREKLSAVNASF